MTEIKSLHAFVDAIRDSNTIDEIIMQLEHASDDMSSRYDDPMIDNYLTAAKKLLEEFSKEVGKIAQNEIVKKEKI